MKILTAWPLHYHIPVPWLYNWLAMDKSDCTGTVAIDGVQLSNSFNQLVKMALEEHEHWDRLVFHEHDVLPPVDGFTRMANYPDGADIVGTIYFQHEPPHLPYIYMDIGRNDRYGILTSEDVAEWIKNPALYACAAVGFGFTGITRRVFEQWDKTVSMFEQSEPWGTQDLWFCSKAREQGFNVFVDSGVVCGHLTTAPITLADNQRFVDGRSV